MKSVIKIAKHFTVLFFTFLNQIVGYDQNEQETGSQNIKEIEYKKLARGNRGKKGV